ncbi:hypothetical protein Tco_1168405, partial [Tanacetum coccineum]
ISDSESTVVDGSHKGSSTMESMGIICSATFTDDEEASSPLKKLKIDSDPVPSVMMKLEGVTLRLKYWDKDNDLILVACDSDLAYLSGFLHGLRDWVQQSLMVLFSGDLISLALLYLIGAAASVSLSVHSESDVDEDSWITFFDFSSSGSLGVVSDTGSLIVTPPTGARPYGRNVGSKLSLIARSMSASAPSPSPFS